MEVRSGSNRVIQAGELVYFTGEHDDDGLPIVLPLDGPLDAAASVLDTALDRFAESGMEGEVWSALLTTSRKSLYSFDLRTESHIESVD
jgi:hypothetical protein